MVLSGAIASWWPGEPPAECLQRGGAVTDEDGNLIYTTGDLGMVRKTYGAATQMGIQYTALLYTPGWTGHTMKDGVNDAGDWAESGKMVRYTIQAPRLVPQNPRLRSSSSIWITPSLRWRMCSSMKRTVTSISPA